MYLFSASRNKVTDPSHQDPVVLVARSTGIGQSKSGGESCLLRNVRSLQNILSG